MPTVLREAGYRFFIYSNERDEPPHVHIQKAEAYAKVWLDTLTVADVNAFNSSRVRQIIAIVHAHQTFRWRPGMSTSASEHRATDVEVTGERLIVRFADGREVSAPLAWFPRLVEATHDQRKHWRFTGGGIGIHWPEVDEDVSVAGLLRPEATLRPRRL